MITEFCTRMARHAWLLCALVLSGCFGTDPGPQPVGGCQDAECSDTPVMVTGGKNFAKIAAGRFHTCGLLANGEVWCWGLNTGGQLGAATPSASLDMSGVPVKVGGNTLFKDITGGDFHTCGIGTDDGVWCWGSNETLVLGVQTVNETCDGGVCSRTPVRAGGALTFTRVDAGSAHNCAIDSSGLARCWGVNAAGELGTSNYSQVRHDANTVSGDHIFTRIASGTRFSCALDNLGAMSCWGLATEGQLATSAFQSCSSGLNNFQCSPTPVAANTPVRFSRIEMGASFGCGMSTGNALVCWGSNAQGQLGNGTFVNSVTPLGVQGTGSWQAFGVGDTHACGIKGGIVLCWGLNDTAQLGTGTKEYANSSPQPVSGSRTYTQIVAGLHHSCALATDGTTWCWGSDKVKQLGRG
jgi:alpha-tubulin suppressor-like RCC1 family protein